MTLSRPVCITLAALTLLAACGPLRSGAPEPAASDAFATALLQASTEAQAGRYGVADRLLGDFATRYASAPEAAETLYWRALFKADPANQVAYIKEAIPLLDAYLALPGLTHHTEAGTLKRLALLAEGRAVPSTTAAPAAVPARADDHSRDEEVQKLKEELQRANAELERIKRRLARPRS